MTKKEIDELIEQMECEINELKRICEDLRKTDASEKIEKIKENIIMVSNRIKFYLTPI